MPQDLPAQGAVPGAAGAVPAEDDWSRLHPLSPVLRGGRFLTAAVALIAANGLRDPGLLALGVGVGTVGAVLLGLVAWRTTRFRVTATELQVRSGLLQRRDRRVPLARLQSVDVVRPLVARLLGLAELRLEVAGGGHEAEAPLAHLGEAEAQRVRALLLARAARAGSRVTGRQLPDAADGAAERPADAAPAGPDETVLVSVPTSALITSALLSVPALLSVLVLVAVVPVALWDARVVPGLFATLLPLLLGTGGQVVRRVLAEYGFTVAASPDGLRLRHGLLETRSQTIPDERVQAVRVVEPLLWRHRDWVRVEVDVAGYAGGPGEDKAGTSALLPVAPRAFALALAERVLQAPLPSGRSPAPAAARWRAPLSARRLAVGLSDTHLVTTSGVLTTTTDVVPLAKVQSLRSVQGPWQRRLHLASVTADTAGRRLSGAVARHRQEDDAAALLAALTEAARRARHVSPLTGRR